jgi:hypothetical protein
VEKCSLARFDQEGGGAGSSDVRFRNDISQKHLEHKEKKECPQAKDYLRS